MEKFGGEGLLPNQILRHRGPSSLQCWMNQQTKLGEACRIIGPSRRRWRGSAKTNPYCVRCTVYVQDLEPLHIALSLTRVPFWPYALVFAIRRGVSHETFPLSLPGSAACGGFCVRCNPTACPFVLYCLCETFTFLHIRSIVLFVAVPPVRLCQSAVHR